jgi:hypothetical protein
VVLSTNQQNKTAICSDVETITQVASFNPDKGDSAFPMELAKPLLINDAIVLFMPIGNGAQTQLDFNSKDIEVWSLAKAGALLLDVCVRLLF